MPEFGKTSRERLAKAHPLLQELLEAVIPHFDITILETERSIEAQKEHVAAGRSKTLDSKHVRTPAEAADIAPYPVRWPGNPPKNGTPAQLIRWGKELARWYYMGGFVLGVASQLRIPVRWGGDWSGDGEFHDQSFDDLPHVELTLPGRR